VRQTSYEMVDCVREIIYHFISSSLFLSPHHIPFLSFVFLTVPRHEMVSCEMMVDHEMMMVSCEIEKILPMSDLSLETK